MFVTRIISLALLSIVLFASACNKEPLSLSDSAKLDYQKAKSKIEAGDYGSANRFLEHYTTNHPYSAYTPKAEILRIYAAYKGGEYVLSETLAARFIKTRPRNPDIAYARYLEAMSNYKQVGKADRDTAPIHRAIQSINALIKDFPNSTYIQDVLPRLQQLTNKLAKREFIVGKFYFERKRFVASANRFKVILDDYQTSPVIEEALYYLAASYNKLNNSTSAHEIAVLLQHNYPKSEWSEKVGEFL